MTSRFRVSNLLVSVAPPEAQREHEAAHDAAPRRLCLITCNDGQHSLVCEPYSRAASPQRLCLITCNDGVHSLVCEPYSRAASPYRWCTMTCLGVTDWCKPYSRQDAAVAGVDELALLKEQLKAALDEIEQMEKAHVPAEPQTADEIDAAEKHLTAALETLRERKASLQAK